MWNSWNRLGKNATAGTNSLEKSYQRQGQSHDYWHCFSYLLLIPCCQISRASCYRNFRIDILQTVCIGDNAENFDRKHWEKYKHCCYCVAKIHWWLPCTRTQYFQIPRIIPMAPVLRKFDVIILTSIVARFQYQNTNVRSALEHS